MNSPPAFSLLYEAVEAGNLVNLRELLCRKDERGRLVVTDDDIHHTVSSAAGQQRVESCRILYNKLSSSGKRYYKTKSKYMHGSPLHEAVRLCHWEVVRLFVEEFGSNVNKKNCYGRTLLLEATESPEMTRYLLGHGADLNQAGPFRVFVNRNSIDLPVHDRHRVDTKPRLTDVAIMNGNTAMLSLLLQRGALVANRSSRFIPETSLSLMLLGATMTSRPSIRARIRLRAREPLPRATKLEICRILVEHAQQGESTCSTSVFLQSSLEHAIQFDASQACCEVLLESGVVPNRTRSLYYAIQGENEASCRLLVQHGADPFLNEKFQGHISPFQAASRQENTGILSFFLDHWDEQFSSQGGKNNDGDYPIHVLCCDRKVSLKAINLVANRQAHTLATVDGEQGLFPFHFAAMWGANLDLIFTLLKHCPDALFWLGQGRTAAAAAAAAAAVGMDIPPHEDSDGSDYDKEGNQDNEREQQVELSGGPAKKKAKITV